MCCCACCYPNQANLLQTAIDSNVDGIAVTLAKPDAMAGGVQAALAAGIPLVGPNSGFDAWQKLGVQQYFGRDENIAGQAAGSRSAIGLLVLRLTSPGIPDHYNGRELRYFALVDHDTRRPVDWLGGPDDARVDRRRDPEAARDPPGACPPRPTP
jgi:Periplasmic binding protein domain